VGTIDHVFPFQRSATAFAWLELGPKKVVPTAKQNVALAHDTLVNTVDLVLAAAEVVTAAGAAAAVAPDPIMGPVKQAIAATVATIGAVRIDLAYRRGPT
jgi:hypothetical protein